MVRKVGGVASSRCQETLKNRLRVGLVTSKRSAATQ